MFLKLLISLKLSVSVFKFKRLQKIEDMVKICGWLLVIFSVLMHTVERISFLLLFFLTLYGDWDPSQSLAVSDWSSVEPQAVALAGEPACWVSHSPHVCDLHNAKESWEHLFFAQTQCRKTALVLVSVISCKWQNNTRWLCRCSFCSQNTTRSAVFGIMLLPLCKQVFKGVSTVLWKMWCVYVRGSMRKKWAA